MAATAATTSAMGITIFRFDFIDDEEPEEVLLSTELSDVFAESLDTISVSINH